MNRIETTSPVDQAKPPQGLTATTLVLCCLQAVLLTRAVLEWLISPSDPFPYAAVAITTLCAASWIGSRSYVTVGFLLLGAVVGVAEFGSADSLLLLSLVALVVPDRFVAFRRAAAGLLALESAGWLALTWPSGAPATLEGLLGTGPVGSGTQIRSITDAWGLVFAAGVGPGMAMVFASGSFELFRGRGSSEVVAGLGRLALLVAPLLATLAAGGTRLFDGSQWGGTIVFAVALAYLGRTILPRREPSAANPTKRSPSRRRKRIYIGAGAAGMALLTGFVWADRSVAEFLRRPRALDYVPYSRLSPELRDATVAMEDGRFTQHHGFDFAGIHRALRFNVREARIAQGGSTITQQLAKNAFLSEDRSAWRKALEAFLTVALERRMTKEEILEKYVNCIDYGMGHRGIAAASQGYFHLPPHRLNLTQASFLVGLVPNPPHTEAQFLRVHDGRPTALRRILFFFPHRYSIEEVGQAEELPIERFVYPAKHRWDRYATEGLETGGLGVQFWFDLSPDEPLAIQSMHPLLKETLTRFLAHAKGSLGLVGIDHIGVYNDRLVRGSSTQASAHAFGQAIDLSGFRFADGTHLRVIDHDRPGVGKKLAAVKAQLRKYFPVVVGWQEDPKLHNDHFHAEVRGPRNFPERTPSPSGD